MRRLGIILFSMFLGSLLVLSGATAETETADKTKISISITSPAKNSSVGREVIVKGTASIPGGHYVWVLVRRKDFKPLWWPQREAEVDLTTAEWSAVAFLGGPQDIGWEFDIGAIVVSRKAHAKLRDYWIKAMQSGDWRPIEIPSTAVAPQIIGVVKTSH